LFNISNTVFKTENPRVSKKTLSAFKCIEYSRDSVNKRVGEEGQATKLYINGHVALLG